METLGGTAADHETRISSTESDVNGNLSIYLSSSKKSVEVKREQNPTCHCFMMKC